ncbi:MAG: hypothetical protein ACW99F_20530 [Candidatus Hodarchaeales archaeon]|jgi:hypothetical protein
MEFVESKGEGNQYKYLHLVIIQGILYIFLQMSLFLLPIDPNIDYYNHINWGIGFENGLYPYSDFNSNEYPVLSVFGWIAAYNLSPEKTYIWLSVIRTFPIGY